MSHAQGRMRTPSMRRNTPEYRLFRPTRAARCSPPSPSRSQGHGDVLQFRRASLPNRCESHPFRPKLDVRHVELDLPNVKLDLLSLKLGVEKIKLELPCVELEP